MIYLTKFRFRLAGVPPEEAEKEIDIAPNLTVLEVKELVRKTFKLPLDFDIQLILPDKKVNTSRKNEEGQ
ncbi:MAG: hypothetical protein RBG13Loki_2488 [Promethearchaeota archaeon CR_4]|nr:MAG: hypothetical protein RBG13Loki_2488 [Candidatus Lokiarchaeota archaeon CR_4]